MASTFNYSQLQSTPEPTTVNTQNGPMVIPNGAVVIPTQQPFQHLKTVKGLAITQLFIGIISVILGVAAIASLSSTYTGGLTQTGAGIWGGAWIAVTGIIGVCSVRKSKACNINGIYMAFSIISTIASGMAGMIYIGTLMLGASYRYRDSEYMSKYQSEVVRRYHQTDLSAGLHISLLILMSVEFFISIIAAAFSCQRCCCRKNQAGIIIHSAQPVPMVPSGAPGQPNTTYYQMAPPGAQVVNGNVIGGQPNPTYYQMAPPSAQVVDGNMVAGVPMMNGGQVVSGGYTISQAPPYTYSSVEQPGYVQSQHPMQTDVTYSEKPTIG